MELGILPSYIGNLMVQTGITGQYWFKEKLDLKLGLTSGSYNGLILGFNQHLANKMVTITEKFKFEETESSNAGGRTKSVYRKFYKTKTEVRKIKGFTSELRAGLTANTNNLFTQFRAGLDWQGFARNYLEVNGDANTTYPGNRNGWFSIKALGMIQYYRDVEAQGNARKNYMEVGALGSLTAVKSPWKTISFTLVLDLGAMYGPEGITPIITPGFGLSINLIKSKKEIEY